MNGNLNIREAVLEDIPQLQIVRNSVLENALSDPTRITPADYEEFLTQKSAEFQELIDWNIVEAQNRLYYRTIEDINKNGAFDKNDLVHYYYVDLLSSDWKTEKYDPIENGNKE